MYRNFPKHFVRGMFGKLGHHLAHWHAELKNWYTVWHIGTPRSNIGTSYGTLTRLWERWHVNHAGVQAR